MPNKSPFSGAQLIGLFNFLNNNFNKMKDKKLVIKITNKGAGIGLLMFSSSLVGLMAFHNQHPKIKTIEKYKKNLLEKLEKSIKWTEREDDGTVDKKELAKIRKEAKKTIKWVQKVWKK